MRKWSCLAAPITYNSKPVHKIMVYQTPKEGTYVFLYDNETAQISFADEWYEELDDALQIWEPRLDAKGWITIDDPLPGCRHDSSLPIRVKGRDTGVPQWDEFEVLRNGSWVPYHE